VTECTKE
jgi:hypothetical protein